MSARMPGRSERWELLLRGVLGLVLVAGVLWALTDGGTSGLGGLLPG